MSMDLWLTEKTLPITPGTVFLGQATNVRFIKVMTIASGLPAEVWFYDGDPAGTIYENPSNAANVLLPRKGRLVEHIITTGIIVIPNGNDGITCGYNFFSGVWVRVALLGAHVGIYTNGNPSPALGS